MLARLWASLTLGSGDAHQFAAGLYHADALRHGGLGVHRVGGGHALHPDRIAATDAEATDLHFPGSETAVFDQAVAISGMRHLVGIWRKISQPLRGVPI
jgi:hypothetical protein